MITRLTLAGLLLASLLLAAGCENDLNAKTRYLTDVRKENGLVIILPGIEGISPANLRIRDALVDAGVDKAIMVYAWGRPVPIVGPALNQMDVMGNKLAGRNVAQAVRDYQRDYPGRPVHIIGHSGGGGVAVFAAEAMPKGHRIDGLVLLSASLSRSYDLSRALQGVRGQIVNFYNPEDSLLEGGTTLAGNVDGGHEPSAGLRGFSRSWPGVSERRVNSRGGDPHFAATRERFVEARVAPLVR